jgi:hypothetical protein
VFRKYPQSKPWLTTALIFPLVVGAFGCDDDDDDNPMTPGGDGATLRVIHASSDAPSVDIYVNDSMTPLYTAVAYGGAGAFLPVDAGTYNVQLRGHGADPSTDPVFETGDLAVPDGATITAIAAGLFNAPVPGGADGFRVLVLNDAFQATGAGQIVARVVHASPDAPAVALDIDNDGTAEVPSLERFADTGEAGVLLPAGTPITVGIRLPGSLDPVTSFTTPALPEGTEAYLIATGLLGEGDPSATDAFKLLAISPSGSLGFITQDDSTVETAQLRVVHASANAPMVDVYLDDAMAPAFRDVSFGDATAYAPVPEGTYTVKLRAAGADPMSMPAFEVAGVVVPGGAVITAGAVGSFASSDAANTFRILPLVEEFTDGGMGDAVVRIVHGSPDAPSVALDVNNDGSAEIPSLARFADTGATGVTLPAGAALQVGVLTEALAPVTAFTTPELPGGENLFLFATGSVAELPRVDEGFRLLAVGEAGAIGFVTQNPTVYGLHGSPDAPEVDVLTGGTVLASDLAFGELTDAIQVAPGAVELELKLSSNGSSVGSFGTPALEAGERYLAVVTGYALGESPVLSLLPVGDGFDVDDAMANVRIVHASPDAPPVDVGVVSGSSFAPLFSNVSFEGTSPAAGGMVSPGTVTLGVAGTGETEALFEFSDVTLPAGLRAFGVAIGSLDGTPGEAFRLALVNTAVSPWTVSVVVPD